MLTSTKEGPGRVLSASTHHYALILETELLDTGEGLLSPADASAIIGHEPLYSFGHDPVDGGPVMSPFASIEEIEPLSEVVRLLTDKGVQTDLHPEAPLLTYSGGTVLAKDLTPGLRLRKIARGVNKNRSRRRVLYRSVTPECKNGTLYQNVFMYEQRHGPVPEDHEVHHKDGDCTNDKHSNLEAVPKLAHRRHHARGSANPRFIDVPDSLLREVWEEIEATGNPVTPTRWNSHIRKTGRKGRVPIANASKRRVRGKSWEEFGLEIQHLKDGANDKVLSIEHVALTAPVRCFAVRTAHGTTALRGSAGDHLHTLVVGSPK